ncbi:hypothetical protein [Caballeronia cordobensis]|uniref:hypothetical protein n=1 Tax=Caballeronia cordobensis TaxID=1353886 RepID=UPI0013594A13|nr:hypothetical protein [Caballeronia cordobensis]
MKGKKSAAASLMIVLSALGFWLSVGYYHSYIDHEDNLVYFLKRRLTLRREFVNPFANEGNPLPTNELSPAVRKELSDFCKYAYGMTDGDEKSLESCRKQAIREVQ